MNKNKPEKNIKEESPGAHTKRFGLVQWLPFVVIIGALAAGYAGSVSNRLDQLESHNLKNLAQAAFDIEKIVIKSDDTIKSLKKDNYACAFFNQSPNLKLIKPRKCDDLSLVGKVSEDSDAEQSKGDEEKEKDRVIDLRQYRVNNALQIILNPNPKDAIDKSGPAHDNEIIIEINFAQLLRVTTFGNAFVSVLIANPSGRVLQQQSPLRHSVFEPPGKDIDAPLRGPIIGDLGKLPLAKVAKGQSRGFASMENSTSVNQVLLAGASYKLMCQPLDLSSIKAQLGKPGAGNWQVCGLVDRELSVRQSLEVASPLALAMLAFVLIGILAWPIVKLFSRRRHERMKFVELYVGMLATIAILSLSTILILTLDRSMALNKASESRLEKLADELEANFNHERKKLLEQLSAYDDEFEKLSNTQTINVAEKRPLFSTPDLLVLPADRESNDKDKESELRLSQPAKYPYFTQLFWTRPCDGYQVAKAAVRGSHTPFVSVASRDYFKAVKTNSLWPEDYYVQSDYSLTTGRFFVAFSMASTVEKLKPYKSDDCNEEESNRPAAVMTTRPLSIIHPVLAPGVGFAIVDKKGKAVFHSDERRAALENMLNDEGIAHRLGAAMLSKASVHFSGSYRTRPHHFYSKAMKGTPWFIVTFVDNEIIRTSALEVLASATLFITMHLLVLGLVTGIYILVFGRDAPGWIWPMAHLELLERIALYRGSGWLLAATLFASLTALSLLPADLVYWAIFPPLIPLICVMTGLHFVAAHPKKAIVIGRAGVWTALVIFVLTVAAMIGFGAWAQFLWVALALVLIVLMRPWRWQWSQYRLRGYMITSMLMWLLISIPSAIGYFKNSHHNDMTVLSMFENDFKKRSSDYRYDKLKEEFKMFTFAAANDTTVKELSDASCKNALNTLDLYVTCASTKYPMTGGLSAYLSANTNDSASDATGNIFDSIRVAVSRYLPIYNETTEYSRYRRQQTDLISGARTGKEKVYPLRPGLATLGGGAVIIVLLWGWVTYGARRLFFGELDPRANALSIADLIAHRIKRHTIATLASRAQYAWISTDRAVHSIFDLSKSSVLDELEAGGCDGKIMCTHLSDALKNGEQRLRVLSLLEKLAQRPQGELLVITSVPIASTRSTTWSGSDASTLQDRPVDFPFETDGESARWHDLLGQFWSVEVSVRGHKGIKICPKSTLWKMPDQNWLECELGAIAGLSDIMGQDYLNTLTKPLSRREVLKEIGKRASWFYQSLWDNCSTDEKLVLTQLSREGVINPRQAVAVRSLLARGLLRMDPELTPVNNSFGQFVASAYDPVKVRQLESRAAAKGMNKRVVFLGLILVVLLFLWFTQRDVVETWIAYIGAIAVGMSAVLRMMDGLKGGGPQR